MKKDEGGIKKIVDLLNVLFLCGEKDKVWDDDINDMMTIWWE
jgi:hypothetical protein